MHHNRQIAPRGTTSRPNHSVDVVRNNHPFDMMAHFNDMNNHINQMFKGFMGFGMGNDMFGPLMNRHTNPMEDIFKFSDMHQRLHDKKSDGAFAFQSYVSSSHMGSDGKMHTESYFENNVAQHRQGNTISQKQQAYKNSQGIKRIAEERMLNNEGRKIVKEQRGNDVEQTNHYYNIDDTQAADFDNRWGQANKNMGFHDTMGKYIMGNPQYQPNMGIEYRGSQRQAPPTPAIQYHQQPVRHHHQQPVRHSQPSQTRIPTGTRVAQPVMQQTQSAVYQPQQHFVQTRVPSHAGSRFDRQSAVGSTGSRRI